MKHPCLHSFLSHALLLIIGFAFFATSGSSAAEVTASMDKMVQQTFKLKPFIIIPSEYSASKNQKKIKESLEGLVAMAATVHKEDAIKDTPLEMSAFRLLRQLQESASAFSSGNKDYSLWLLRGSLSNCLACHTQTPSGSTQFRDQTKKAPLYNSFQEAEFLYLARNYPEALKLYTQAIAEFPNKKINSTEVEQALYRKVYYYARISRDLTGLQKDLQLDLKNKSLTATLSKIYKEYQESAQALAHVEYPQFTLSQTEDLRKFAESALQEELSTRHTQETAAKTLNTLRLSSVLYEYLHKYPQTSLTPEIYYWLSLCENHPRKFSFEFMSELYLRKCITDYPSSSVAPKCLKEYKDLVAITYTGSSGSSLPENTKRELQSMDMLLQNIKE